MSNKEEKSPLLADQGVISTQPEESVWVCTSSGENDVQGLINVLKTIPTRAKFKVCFELLPYNIDDLNKMDLSHMNKMLLCHSIENRRFSLTNVTDALYDKFLPKASKKLGKSNVGVIVYDFPEDDVSGNALKTKMNAFRINQPTTCDSSSFVILTSKLEVENITDEHKQRLITFLENRNGPQMGNNSSNSQEESGCCRCSIWSFCCWCFCCCSPDTSCTACTCCCCPSPNNSE